MCIQFHARSLKRNVNIWYKAKANELSRSNENGKKTEKNDGTANGKDCGRKNIICTFLLAFAIFTGSVFLFLLSVVSSTTGPYQRAKLNRTAKTFVYHKIHELFLNIFCFVSFRFELCIMFQF